MNDEDKRAMLQELLATVRRKTRDDYPQPNITAAEYAELEGMTHAAAYNRLEYAVELGKLVKGDEKVVVDEHHTCIYWKA